MKRILLCGAVGLALAHAAAGAPIVGFTNVQGVAAYPQSMMDAIGQFKWFFAHASVGGNMMSGIADLHSSNTNFYRIESVSDDGTPPATTQARRVYEYNRGNPGWQPKFDDFTVSVSNGWRFPKINFALNKLCFIDPDADVNYYINSMTSLEGHFPETVFLYATIPLTTSSDSDNYLRNVYNDTLRGWCASNNRVLFDIADIEAHETNGTEHTFTYSGRTCQLLYDGYTTDGGHLDDAGNVGRKQVAKGFYAIAAALLTSDRDGDGMSDGEELIAGMCPTSSASVFRFSAPANAPSGNCIVAWSSSSNRYYGLQRTTNLAGSATFTNLLTNSAATPPMNCYTDSPAGTGPFFYKLSVHQ